MAKRKKIGLALTYDNKSNSGIVNYVISIINALKGVEENRKPELIIYHSKNAPIEQIKSIDYPYIKFELLESSIKLHLRLWEKILWKAYFCFTGKGLNLGNYLKYKADYIFPYFGQEAFSYIPNKIYWIVDFNLYYYDKKFSDGFKDFVRTVINSAKKTVVSSYNVYDDLRKFHPNHTCKVEVLRFAAVLTPYENVNLEEVKKKYGIEHKYFMTPNQFWRHKNHQIILKAVLLVKEQFPHFHVLFTGSLNVEEGDTYLEEIKNFIKDNGLTENVKILGIVERSSQLKLMKNAVSLIQPSMFEGWSTLVEESKALNQHIIVSDIPVHREQIKVNCTFFNPTDEVELAHHMLNILQDGVKYEPYDYQQDIRNYANRILEIFD